MIVWLSSYPKSGNTFLRIILSDYFFNNSNHKLNLDLLSHISRYPKLNFFNSFINDGLIVRENIKNREKFILLNYQAQFRNFNKGNYFLKTHCKNYIENNIKFTDNKITKAAIYIVRDPRNVLLSYSDYFNTSIDEAFEQMTREGEIEYENMGIKYPGIIGSWKSNYLSWKNSSKEFPVKIIKYEDLTGKTYATILDILIFLKNNGVLNKIDKEKVKNSISKANLENLKNIENKHGFSEKNESSDKPFFNLGEKRNWKKVCKVDFLKKVNQLNEIYKNEIEELGYSHDS